jgi:hypothetical protein
MGAICSKIAANILYNCANMVAGIKNIVYFINVEDIDKDGCAFDPTNPLLLTQLYSSMPAHSRAPFIWRDTTTATSMIRRW